MALLSVEQETARSTEEQPFSNGFEGESWMAYWCDRCVHFEYCPLLTVAYLGRTPFGWIEENPRGLADRYICTEHRRTS